MDANLSILAGAYLVFEIFKFVLPKLLPKPNYGLKEQEREWLKDLHVWHNSRDVDGRLNWFVPSNFHDSQEKVLEALRDISYTQKETVKILERIVTKLEESNH